MTAPPPSSPFHDVRSRGFARRVPLTDAWDWVDARVAPPPARILPLAECAGLRLADAVAATGDWPPADRAAVDGFAVAAADTLGAGSYNPVPLTAAVAVSAGDPLTPGCDAVIPFEAAQAVGPFIEAIDAVAPGSGVERRGAWTVAGSPLLPAGRRLRAGDLGLLAAIGHGAGHGMVAVLPAPQVRILIAGGPKSGAPEQLGAMLAALVGRDGGVVVAVEELPADLDALAEAFARPGADLILSAGRTGTGPDDVAPSALAQAGSLDLHGIAMRPGGSAGLGLGGGLGGGVPVLLLPGEPMAALAAYELLAGRAVRRAAGLPAVLPHATVEAVTARKLVSEIGSFDLYRVRLDDDGRVEPVASPGWPGLAAAARADGFVLIGADSEGVPDGAAVIMYRFA